MEKSGAKAYLVNTGWNGTGKRISIRDTRGIIDAILDGAIVSAPDQADSSSSTSRCRPQLPGVDPARFSTPATPMPITPLNGLQRLPSSPRCSPTTSRSSSTTKPARLSVPQVPSSKPWICNPELNGAAFRAASAPNTTSTLQAPTSPNARVSAPAAFQGHVLDRAYSIGVPVGISVGGISG